MPLAMMIDALEGAGFEVRDVESPREHYAVTLRAWVAHLERRWDEAAPAGYPGASQDLAAMHGRLRARVRARMTGTSSDPAPAPLRENRQVQSIYVVALS